jgi:hypothetical protein
VGHTALGQGQKVIDAHDILLGYHYCIHQVTRIYWQ